MADWRQLGWLILVDSLAWGVLHLVVAWAGTRLPASWFAPRFLLFRPLRWEQRGWVCERVFGVRRWKDLLPDGAAWFSRGFPKAGLARRDSPYLERFVAEMCRGEAVHWVVLSCSGLFFLWNPRWLACCMVLYAITANLPCIIAQRYNRPRMARVLDRSLHPVERNRENADQE